MATRNINGLTAKQQVFCDLYRASEDPDILGNAKRCYMIAYGATAKSAEANGPRVLKDKHVKTYLDNKTEQVMDKFDIQEEDLLKVAHDILFMNTSDLFDEKGKPISLGEMGERAQNALTVEIVQGKNASVKIKQHEKKGVLELLMKYKKMLTDKVEHSGEVKGGVLLIPADAGSTEAWLKQHYPSQK